MIKKITAILGGLSLVGATIMGATASAFPEPFVKDGIMNGEIVVGANADAQDIVGAIDIGASLQFDAKSSVNVDVMGTDAVLSDGIKIEKSGNEFNYGESLSDVQGTTVLGEEDLPFILSDGNYVENEGITKNTEDYTQELSFEFSEPKLVYDQDDELAMNASEYFYIKDGSDVYSYALDFDSNIEYDDEEVNDDFKTSTIEIQGKIYTITDVSDTAGVVDKITMISGDAVMWLTQNQEITKNVNGESHTIEVVDVTEDADACQVKIDGTEAIIDTDSTETINGVQIGITDVRAIHAQLEDVDVCQVTLGANELELKDGSEVEKDGVTVDGAQVTFDAGVGTLKSITIDYEADIEDDIYLSEGGAFIDPVFGSWKIAYGGLATNSYTEHEVDLNAEEGSFTFENNNGKEVVLDVWTDETVTEAKLGSGPDEDEQILAAGVNVTMESTIVGTNDVADVEGTKILAADIAGEARVFEVTNIDVGDATVSLKDLTNDKDHDDITYVDATNSVLDLGSFGSIEVNINAGTKSLTVVDSVKAQIETDNELELNIDDTSDIKITMGETLKLVDETTPDTLTIDITQDVDYELDVDASFGNAYVSGVETKEDSDYTVSVSEYGTKIIEGDNSLKVEVPSNEVYGNVYVAPLVASFESTTSSIDTGAYTLNKINNVAKLDTETTAGTVNQIIVGGPCANKITAQVLGLTYPTCGAASTIEPNTGMIKAIAQLNGKVAMVVAGWEAGNTRAASRVLANYEDYDILFEAGNTYTVTGLGDSLSVTKVEATADVATNSTQ